MMYSTTGVARQAWRKWRVFNMYIYIYINVILNREQVVSSTMTIGVSLPFLSRISLAFASYYHVKLSRTITRG